MAIAIFVFDTITDLEIAVAAFYVVVVLVSVMFCQTPRHHVDLGGMPDADAVELFPDPDRLDRTRASSTV